MTLLEVIDIMQRYPELTATPLNYQPELTGRFLLMHKNKQGEYHLNYLFNEGNGTDKWIVAPGVPCSSNIKWEISQHKAQDVLKILNENSVTII